MNSTTAPVWCKVPRFEIARDSKLDIPAYGGRLDVKWDPGTKVTPSGGLAYFAVFLKVTGFFDSLCSDFPVDYRSNNSSSRRDIVGTIVLAILFGKDRYVQINALRNDTASMELLGLRKIVSEDTVRRSLRDADGKALDAWLSRHEHEVVDSMLRFAYVIDIDKDRKGREWDYCILVTNEEKLDLTALSQLYRDRGDCENNFDEFKNQWGWSGFTTKQLKPCKAMARLIAIVANLWNVFVRLADPDAHREPVTSRPAFLNIIGRIVMNGGRRVIHLTSTHAEADAIRASLCLIGKFLEWVNSIAEQLNQETTWTLVLAYAFRKLLRLKPSRGPIPALIPA